MSTHSDFISAIAAAPRDDASRLVYADWLEEHNDAHAADYLRAELDLAKLPLDSAAAPALRNRLWQAWANVEPRWLMTFTQPRMLRANPTPFPTMWMNFGLGKLRARQGTYGAYAYDQAPELSIDEMHSGFKFVVPGSRAPESADQEQHRKAFEATLRDAATNGIRLPPAFLTFMKNRNLQYAFNSPTDCFFTLPDEYTFIRRDPASDCFHVHFFCDSQSCLLWDLYVHPSGAHCVIARWPDYFESSPDLDESDEPAYTGPRAWFVAPSFEAFVYRVWLENEVWYIEHSDGQFLGKSKPQVTPAIQAYMDHYRKQATQHDVL